MAQISEWEIKRFIWVVLAAQLAILALVGLTTLGFDIPLFRQIIGFIYLTFIPGLLILRIFKLHRLGNTEVLLYAVGLSVAFVMFLGFFINMLCPLIGIPRPISSFPVISAITVAVFLLCAIAYKREGSERRSSSPYSCTQWSWSELLSPPVLLLFLLPLLSVLGTRLVYLHQSNAPLFMLLSLIAFIVILVSFGKFIPEKLYPLAIAMISISLLWHISLVSPSVIGGDIVVEQYIQKQVISNSIWDYTVFSNINAMLSIVMLGPIYSLVLNLDADWVFKIIYPLLFSLVPLALFQVYRGQTGNKIAFLGAFFFMSMPVFFSEMPTLARQGIAELFLALSVLLFLNRELTAAHRVLLSMIFGFSIVVSHYGLSYTYMLYLLMSLPLLLLWRSNTVKKMWSRIATRFSKLKHSPNTSYHSIKLTSEPWPQRTLTRTYVVLFIVFCLTWYMYVSSSAPFNAAVSIVGNIYYGISTGLFSFLMMDPHILQALGLAQMRGGGVEWEIARVFQYITQLFILIGIIGLIVNLRKARFHPEYVVMSLVSMVLIAVSIILPRFATSISMTRIYHVTLFFLSPFCILGGIAFFRWLFWILHIQWLRNMSTSVHLTIVVLLVLVPYFLFGSGFIFELTGVTRTSMPLAPYKVGWAFFTKPEISACQWLEDKGEDGFSVYSDVRAQLYAEFGPRAFPPPVSAEEIYQDSYIFFRRWTYVNLEGNPILSDAVSNRNKIYNSGGSQIFAPK